MSEDKVKEIIEAMQEITGDSTVPKNVRAKIENSIKALRENTEIAIRVDKVMNELDQISDDTNMEPYTRSQIWNLVSELETLR